MKTFGVYETPKNSRWWPNFPFEVMDNRTEVYGHWETLEEAEGQIRELEWYQGLPVGLRAGGILGDARAVGSRARWTLEYLGRYPKLPVPPEDSEEEEIRRDLEKVVEILDRWKRTGKTPKYPG